MDIGAGITFGPGVSIVPPPTVPGAPTIGVATATSGTTATVTFTAPVNNGGATITSYTATSSPGSITGILSQAGSGTITVTGLTPSTSYTFTVTATNSVGTSSASSASNSISTPAIFPSVIGEPWGGGYYAGKISTSGNGVATHYLIIAPKSTEILGKRWAYPYNENVNTGADSFIEGPSNTTAMYNNGSEVADYVRSLTTGGYNDWYLPARNELEVLYYFLKPSTDSNNTGSGSNANAVAPEPRNTYYTSGSPAQTTAAIFQFGGAQQLEPRAGQPNYPYWSSTEQNDGPYAFYQQMDQGLQQSIGKANTTCLTRAVRRIPV